MTNGMASQPEPGRFPERRRGVRILTWRNLRNVTIVLVVVFAIISIRSEMRDTTEGRYGRLYGRQVTKAAPELPAQPNIVTEAPAAQVADESHADPMLVAPAAREAYLGTPDQPFTAQPTVTADATAFASPKPQIGDVAIVGGPDGVSVVSNERQARPVLSGGFMRH